MKQKPIDAVIIGSGPNGLSAAIRLAQQGFETQIVEAKNTIGGGMRTAELTLPGFFHDICSAAHPMGILSPFFRTLPLQEHGLTWIQPPASVAHPMPDGSAVMLWKSLQKTMDELEQDGPAYSKLISPFLKNPHGLLGDILGPLSIPKHPIQMIRFGLKAIRSATGLANSSFRHPRAKALFAGCAGHAILPLEHMLTAALGLVFSLTGHVEEWPVAKGGSASIAKALADYFTSLGGTIRTNTHVRSLDDLPPAKVILFDTSPKQLQQIAANHLPTRYKNRLQKYHYGPGVFKLDWALREPIPWSDKRCLQASTVHVGGTMEEISLSERQMWNGKHQERPFLLVCQQSLFDQSRAPAGQHTGYAYCHTPANSTVDMTAAIENQIERFAPGFTDTILARHKMNCQDFSAHNPNYIGGAITGGVANIWQAFSRPVARLNPYTTPNPKLFICSASSPPGGGVHGMCGFYAAQAAIKRLHKAN